jgi:hypothetical protein
MKNPKNRTAATVISMLVIAFAVLSFYFYWTYRTNPMKKTSVENRTEAEKLIARDLTANYPQTPREVVKLFGRFMKALYNDVKDKDMEPLALKVRELYDEEFLNANPEEEYLQKLYSDIASWKDKDRKITNYILVKEELEQQEEIDGVQYATVFISFTVQEGRKVQETWRMLLRQDEKSRWKILGWQLVRDDKEEQK